VAGASGQVDPVKSIRDALVRGFDRIETGVLTLLALTLVVLAQRRSSRVGSGSRRMCWSGR
jgi:hypothetical protein